MSSVELVKAFMDALEAKDFVMASSYLTNNFLFILPPLGTPPIPQMAGTIAMPEEQWSFTLENGKIARIVVNHVAGGSIQGLLHQLGVNLLIEQ